MGLTQLPPHLRRCLCGVFDEPLGVSPSNEATDNFENFDDPIVAEISGIKSTHASTTSNQVGKTARTKIAKPTPRSLIKATKRTPTVIRSKSAAHDSDDEAEKRRERVRKCRRKQKEKKAKDLLKMENLVADNIQREANIASLEQQLAQMRRIIAAHNYAQPDAAAALLSSLF